MDRRWVLEQWFLAKDIFAPQMTFMETLLVVTAQEVVLAAGEYRLGYH